MKRRKFYTYNVEPTADLIHPVWAIEAAETRGKSIGIATTFLSRPLSALIFLLAALFPSSCSRGLAPFPLLGQAP